MISLTRRLIFFVFVTVTPKLAVSYDNPERETKESTIRQVSGNLLSNWDFEGATISPWEPIVDEEGAIVKKSEEHAHSGKFGLVTGRTEKGDGICQDITNMVELGVPYEGSLWAKFIDVPNDYSNYFDFKIHNRFKQKINDIDMYHDAYHLVAGCNAVLTNEWTKITGSYVYDDDDLEVVFLKLCAQGPSNTTFAIDDVSFQLTKPEANAF